MKLTKQASLITVIIFKNDYFSYVGRIIICNIFLLNQYKVKWYSYLAVLEGSAISCFENTFLIKC